VPPLTVKRGYLASHHNESAQEKKYLGVLWGPRKRTVTNYGMAQHCRNCGEKILFQSKGKYISSKVGVEEAYTPGTN
jgi:DNA-directed RNA polymerase subunit RPC12/RpoP